MPFFSFSITLNPDPLLAREVARISDRQLNLITRLIHFERKIVGQVAELQAEVAALKEKTAETVVTLHGLVVRILALENALQTDPQALAQLIADVKQMNVDLGLAEDAADDHAPAVTVPPPDPAPTE